MTDLLWDPMVKKGAATVVVSTVWRYCKSIFQGLMTNNNLPKQGIPKELISLCLSNPLYRAVMEHHPLDSGGID